MRTAQRMIAIASAMMLIGIMTMPLIVVEASEVELMDGKYVMSDEFQITDSATSDHDYWGNDCADGIISYTYWNDTSNVYGLGYYNMTTETNHIIDENAFYYIDVTRTDNGVILGVWDNQTLSIYYTQNSTHVFCDWDDFAQETGLWDGTIAYSRVSVTNDTIEKYFINNESLYNVFEDDGSSSPYISYTMPDIHEDFIVSIANTIPIPADRMTNITWYNRTTGVYGSTAYDNIIGTDVFFSNLRVWDYNVVGKNLTWGGSIDRSIGYWNLSNIVNGNPEYQTISDIHDSYDTVDISHDMVVYDAENSTLGFYGIYGSDINGEEFNISVDYDAWYPSVWIGDDGYGYVCYSKENGVTGFYDVYMRYLNDTTLFSEPSEEPVEEPEEDLTAMELFWQIFLSLMALLILMAIMRELFQISKREIEGDK